MSSYSKLKINGCCKAHVFDCVNIVVDVLNKYSRKLLDEQLGENQSRIGYLRSDKHTKSGCVFTNGATITAYDMRCINVQFGDGSTYKRSVNVICDDDGAHILSGVENSGAFMQLLGEHLTELGDVYYTPNECSVELTQIK